MGTIYYLPPQQLYNYPTRITTSFSWHDLSPISRKGHYQLPATNLHLQPICNLQSATCNLQSAICNLQSAICNLQSAICNLQSAICNPTCNLQPATVCDVGADKAPLARKLNDCCELILESFLMQRGRSHPSADPGSCPEVCDRHCVKARNNESRRSWVHFRAFVWVCL
jgi:hypothetical protein